MELSTIIGTVGVSLLLLGFLFNLFGILSEKSITYILLNVSGAAVACVASIMIRFYPFIVLEIIWTIVGIVGLVRYFRSAKGKGREKAPFTIDP